MLWPRTESRHADAADLRACAVMLRAGSKTFFAASRLLPPRLREPVTVLYAFCRLADDAADLGGGGERIAQMQRRLTYAYDGRPADLSVDRALADLVRDFSLPRELLEALFEGFAWDAELRRYATLDDLLDYAARVAGTVGAMMSVLMGCREPKIVARACELGMAMQLTNIARDVGEDAAAGRLYLPLDWLVEAGVEPEAWLARPYFAPAIGDVVARLLEAADRLYRRAEPGIAALPADCRPGIRAARFLYAEIGGELARQGLNSIDRRAMVPAWRKAALMSRALMLGSAGPVDLEPSPAAEFLIEAVARVPTPAVDPAGPIWWNVARNMGRMIELLQRIEQRRVVGRA